MAPVPEGEIFSPTIPALWVTINHLNLKQFKTVHYRIHVRTDTTDTVRYLTETQFINQLLMSCQCTEIDLGKGWEKGDFLPPHTAT